MGYTVGSLRPFVAALPPVLGFVLWVVTAALAATSVPTWLPEHPTIAWAMVQAIAITGGVGGLVGFWCSAPAVEFLVRGYRVRCLTGTQCVYEERAADGSIQRLPFNYRALGDEYRPPCEVSLPSHERWDERVPSWAGGRRAEIEARIAKALGVDVGASVRFTDAVDL